MISAHSSESGSSMQPEATSRGIQVTSVHADAAAPSRVRYASSHDASVAANATADRPAMPIGPPRSRAAGRTPTERARRPAATARSKTTVQRELIRDQPLSTATSSTSTYLALAEDDHDDREADRGFGGGDRDHQKREDVSGVVDPARANAMNARFAAFHISSIAISTMSGLRRATTPATPMKNMTAESADVVRDGDSDAHP